MNYSSGLSSTNFKSNDSNNNNNVCQEILSSDAKYNLYRIHNNSQLRTLYMRRRNQLLRENAAKHKDKDISDIRRSYLFIRNQILEQKYGPIDQSSLHNHSYKGSKANSKAPSIDSVSLNYDWRDSNKRLYGGGQNLSNIATALNPKHSSIESLNIANTTSSSVSLSRLRTTTTGSLNNSAMEENSNYSFAGVHHIFDNHKGSVTRVRFANNDKSLLATCSLDGSLVICQVIPSPATTIYKLEGHQSGIMDMQWSTTNDLIVTASLDGTSRVWQVTKGKCMRVLKDTCGAQVLCCCFQPLNENMIFTGNSKGLIQVYNLSTGIIVNKNCLQKVVGRVETMCFDSAGTNLWIGDDKGTISAFQFDAFTLKFTKTRKITSNNGYSITSISYKNSSSKEAPLANLLVNAKPNYLLLYRLTSTDSISLRLRKKIFIKQTEHSIRSTFCPVSSKAMQASCLVCTGSEDGGVYLYDLENDERPLINKLQGHSSPVKDVAFNYDQSLLASGDFNGTVIVWKTNNQS